MTYNLDRTPLSDLCEAIVDCEHKTAPKQDFGIPSIRTTDIKNGRLDIENANRVSEETYIQWTARLEPQPNDLILAREAPVGEVGIVPLGQRVCLGQRTVLIRPDKNKLFPRYLLYLLLTSQMRHALTSRAEGSVVPHLNMSAIRGLELPLLPPLDEQKAIAHILGTLDDKIELNQQMNQTLEAIARALFKSWFIDFDPVRAKLDGRQPIGMDAETAALFPAEFEDSALGEIPKGWKIQTSESIFSVKDGTHDSPKVAEAGYPLVTSRHLKKGYIDFDNTYLISEDDFHEVNKRSKVDKNDVLITMIGTVGNLLFIDYEEVNFAIKNVGLFKTSEKPELSEYFYFYLRSDKIENYLKIRQAGTTQSYITLKTLRTIPVLLPSSELVRLFSKSVTPQLQKITATREESHLLVSIRDALLPKLLSGEIRVQDAETVVEAVT